MKVSLVVLSFLLGKCSCLKECGLHIQKTFQKVLIHGYWNSDDQWLKFLACSSAMHQTDPEISETENPPGDLGGLKHSPSSWMPPYKAAGQSGDNTKANT